MQLPAKQEKSDQDEHLSSFKAIADWFYDDVFLNKELFKEARLGSFTFFDEGNSSNFLNYQGKNNKDMFIDGLLSDCLCLSVLAYWLRRRCKLGVVVLMKDQLKHSGYQPRDRVG